MRTLPLLTALLLLAFLAQAQTKHRMGQQSQDPYQAEHSQDTYQAEQSQETYQAGAKGQAGTEGQDVVINLKKGDHHRKGAAGFHRTACTFRQGPFCKAQESPFGTCNMHGAKYKLCCH